MPEQLREDLQRKSEASRQTMPSKLDLIAFTSNLS
jgi:hypothetical protein